MTHSYKQLLKEGRQGFFEIEKEKRTYAVCLDAVLDHVEVFSSTPIQFRTEEMSLAAVRQDGLKLSYVPNESKTFEVCHAAVQKNGNAIEHVPMHFLELLIPVAVKQYDGALYFVPYHLQTLKICQIAIQTDPYVFYYISAHLWCDELYWHMITTWPLFCSKFLAKPAFDVLISIQKFTFLIIEIHDLDTIIIDFLLVR